MKINVKKIIATLSLASLFFVAIPQQRANAGILLSPAGGSGVILIVLGVVYDSLGLIILNDEPTDAMVRNMENRYGNLTDNQQVFINLSDLIMTKIEKTDITTETELAFSLEEIKSTLGASVNNSELLEKVKEDLL